MSTTESLIHAALLVAAAWEARDEKALIVSLRTLKASAERYGKSMLS